MYRIFCFFFTWFSEWRPWQGLPGLDLDNELNDGEFIDYDDLSLDYDMDESNDMDMSSMYSGSSGTPSWTHAEPNDPIGRDEALPAVAVHCGEHVARPGTDQHDAHNKLKAQGGYLDREVERRQLHEELRA